MSLFAVLATGADPIRSVIEASASPYPASFDNNPLLFAWALFSRLFIFNMALCTALRIKARTRTENISGNHPVYYHRMVTRCFLWAFVLGAGSDSLFYLSWNELCNPWGQQVVLTLTRVMDGVTFVPFLMALFVPWWLPYMQRVGAVRIAPTIILNGVVNDIRSTWDTAEVPLKLLWICLFVTVVVTFGKYLLWLNHVCR